MQFQRLQSLYIFLAAVAMFIFCFAPFGQILVPEGQPAPAEVLVKVDPSEFFGIYLSSVLSGIVLLISLFLFKALKFQHRIVLIGTLFTICTIGLTCFTLFKGLRGFDATFTVWDVTLIAAAVFEIAALGRIRHDQKLLASYNRLR